MTYPNILNNLDLLEEQDKFLFQTQCLSQGNKTITYTTKNNDGSDYLGIQGSTAEETTVDVYVTKEPTIMNSYNEIMLPYIEMSFDLFDDDNLIIGKTFEYNDYEFTVSSRYKSLTNRITIRGRAAVK